jgi:hypothetical protein
MPFGMTISVEYLGARVCETVYAPPPRRRARTCYKLCTSCSQKKRARIRNFRAVRAHEPRRVATQAYTRRKQRRAHVSCQLRVRVVRTPPVKRCDKSSTRVG